jgi:hypothetical protein
MNLNPSNGQNYYLAEAWLKRESLQARGFKRLAAVYLADDAGWMIRVKNSKKGLSPAGPGLP